MANLRRSLVINFLSTSGAAVLQFIVSILLARMLTPAEIGVYSMAAVFVYIGHTFRDFGVASYLQREPDLTTEKIRSAIGVMFASTWSIALILYLISTEIGDWFKEPGIVPIMRLLAIGFLVIPFGAITHAMLVRELAADKQAVVSAASTVSYCISCVGLAALGFGTMSIGWANLISNIVAAITYIPFRPKGLPWLPSFRHWRGIANFGMGTLLTNCANAINHSIPDVLLGKLGNARNVGLFSRANSTVSIFTYAVGSTINYGAVSYLSQSHHRGESLVPTLRRATALITGIGWPAYALIAMLGHDIVITLYGAKWVDSVPAILPLALAAAVSMLFQYTPPALTAIGRPYLGAFPVVVTLTARICFGVFMFDGTLSTFAWAICLATLAAAPVGAFQQRRYFGLRLTELLSSVKPSLMVTILCIAACEAIKYILPPSLPPLARLLILALPMITVWYAALRLTSHPLANEIHLLAAGVKSRVRPG